MPPPVLSFRSHLLAPNLRRAVLGPTAGAYLVLGKMGVEDFGELFDRLRQLGCCLLSVYEDLEAFVVPAPSVSSQAYSYSALRNRFPSLQVKRGSDLNPITKL